MFPQLGDSDRSKQHRRNRPPPNYSSRRVQVRLLMLVFAVMIVVLAMQKAGDPEFWGFMGFDDDKLTEQEKASAEFDSRLLFTPDGTPVSADDETASEEEFAVETRSALDRVKYDGWEKAIDKLTDEERTLLAKVLKRVRDKSSLDDADQLAWHAVVTKLDQHWQEFLRIAWSAVTRLEDNPQSKKAAWIHTLRQVESEWNLRLKRDLDAAKNPGSVAGETTARLDALQLLLDELALDSVRDNTISLQPRHRETQYRLLDRLNGMSQDELQGSSVGRVGIIQLARQPKHYRGKVVTIRGTAKTAIRITAPTNVFGLEQWYVFWVRPLGGSPQPYTVYTLEVPESFPEIGDTDTEIDEDVEFTGFFFRNGGYAATDVVRTRPVLLAKTITWEPSVMDKVELPRATAIVLTVIGVAAVAILIAVVIYVRSRRTPEIVTRFSTTMRNNSDDLKRLTSDDHVVDVDEVLRQLSEED